MKRENEKNGKIWLIGITVPGKFNVKENLSILHHFIVGIIPNGFDPISAAKWF